MPLSKKQGMREVNYHFKCMIILEDEVRGAVVLYGFIQRGLCVIWPNLTDIHGVNKIIDTPM